MGNWRNRRTIALIGAAALLIAGMVHRPSANIQILAHDSADLAPHKIQAALDLGVMAVNILITWTAHRVTG